MKILILLAATVAVAGSAFAADKKAETPKTIKCAVMGDDVNVKDATEKKMFADYKGNRYFFCCGSCPTAFKKNPAKYAKAAHIPTPTDKATEKK